MTHSAVTFHHLCPAIDIGRYFLSKFSRFRPSECIRTQCALHWILIILSKLLINLFEFEANIMGYVHAS